MVPRSNSKPVDVDSYASHTLANAKTAEEYVSKALEMKNKYEHTTPSSSFVKYDIYDGEKTKLVPIISKPNQITDPLTPKEDISDMAKSGSEYSEFSIEHPQEYVSQTTTTTYKHPSLTAHFKDLDQSNSDYNHHFMSNYDPYDSIKHINHDNRHSFDNAMRTMAGYPSKDEMITYIERAVKKYFKELDLTNKLTNVPMSGSSSAQAEIKTYYRFPSSTTASPVDSTKFYSTGIHSEFFKPSKSHSKPSYATVKPFTLDSYSPEGIDLTIPSSKKRPKPIDLSALDVGQTWQHSSTSHSEPVVSYRKKKKPKIHLNSQTYHDINALPYIPSRGVIYDEYSPFSTPTSLPSSIIEHPSGSSHSYSSHKDHPVAASISFGGHSHNDHHSHHHKKHHRHHGSHSHSHHNDDSGKGFMPSMQVVNGVPVTNPYKFNMDAIK